MLSQIKRYEIAVFFAAILLANYALVAAVHAELVRPGRIALGRFYLLGLILVAVVLLARGPRGITDLLRPMIRWRVPLRWYLFAALWTLAVACLTLAVRYLMGDGWPHATDFRAAFLTRPGILRSLFVAAFVGEIVWISYALRQLAPRIGTLAAAHVIGVVWALWWLPMIVFNIGVLPDLPIIGLVLNQCGIALMCAFLYRRTQSGLLIFVMQLAFNAAVLVIPVSAATGSAATYMTFAGLYYALALALLLGLGASGRTLTAAAR